MAPDQTEPPIEHPEKYPAMLTQLREEDRAERDRIRKEDREILRGLDDKVDAQRTEFKEDFAIFRQEYKEDLASFRQEYKEDLASFRQEYKEDFASFRQEYKEDFANFRQEYEKDLASFRQEHKHDLKGLRAEVKDDIDQVRQDFTNHFERLETAHADMRRWVLTTLTTLVLMVASAGIAVGVSGLGLFS